MVGFLLGHTSHVRVYVISAVKDSLRRGYSGSGIIAVPGVRSVSG